MGRPEDRVDVTLVTLGSRRRSRQNGSGRRVRSRGVHKPWFSIEGAARWPTRRRLRVLAYHDVESADVFARQMQHVCRHYAPVSGSEVALAVRGERELPDYALWVTFDDGHASVVRNGLPVLDALGIRATLFVCPGLIESRGPFWWDVVNRAVQEGIRVQSATELPADALVTALKSVPDHRRRAIVADFESALANRGVTAHSDQMTVAELHQWQQHGQQVGNHTWDHPCLDQSDAGAQGAAIRKADEWLTQHVDPSARVFAYPNGDWTADAELLLREDGYELALLFDHRLAATSQPPYRISRLRVSTRASMRRFSAIVSGAHSAGYHLSRRLRPNPHEDTALRSVPA